MKEEQRLPFGTHGVGSSWASDAENREKSHPPPRPQDMEGDQSYGNGWNHPRKAHRARREDIHPLLYSKAERRKTDQDLERRQWRGWEMISGFRELNISTS